MEIKKIGSDQESLSHIYLLGDELKRLTIETIPLAEEEVNERDRAKLETLKAHAESILQELPKF